MRVIQGTIRELKDKNEEELWAVARREEAPLELVKETAKQGRLPVVNFAAGGIATPADAALMIRGRATTEIMKRYNRNHRGPMIIPFAKFSRGWLKMDSQRERKLPVYPL